MLAKQSSLPYFELHPNFDCFCLLFHIPLAKGKNLTIKNHIREVDKTVTKDRNSVETTVRMHQTPWKRIWLKHTCYCRLS